MIHEILALLIRPAAIIAVFAGLIVLSFAIIAIRRAKRRRGLRAAAERNARRLVGKMRHCPRFSKNEDRRLAVRIVKELTDIATLHGFALHEIGTSQTEIDRILFLVREDVVADPRSKWPNALKMVLNQKEPGTPDIPINSKPLAEGTGEHVLFAATFSVDELAACASPDAPDTAPLQEHVEIIVEEPEPAPEPDPPSDPIQALKTLDDDALDDYIEDSFLALRLERED